MSDTFIRPHVSGFRISLRRARIKYLPETDGAPILLDDIGHREEVDTRLLTIGAGLSGGGVTGSLPMVLLQGHRRRSPAAAA